MVLVRRNVDYGFSQPLNEVPQAPIISNRAPTTADKAALGTLWIEPKNTAGTAVNSAWVITSIINNLANWNLIEASGAAIVGSSLTITPGPISLTGTTGINVTGAATTTIGTGGTGVVAIGNTTGNTAVTGSLTASTGLTATTGGITATGTSNINTSGASVTSINTGGTGALNLGNATGNTAVTGSLTASVNLVSTAGTISTVNGIIQVGSRAVSAAANQLNFAKSRAGAVIVTGDELGDIVWGGYDGTQYVPAAAITSTSSGTIAANRVASDLEFWTHPDSTAASISRMQIAPTGAVTIAAPDSGVGLTVSGGGAAVTGAISATTTLTATLGNITATNGDLVASTAAKGVVLGGGAKVVSGTGDPNGSVTAPQGSLYLRLDGSSSSSRAYINSNAGTTWIAVTTAS